MSEKLYPSSSKELDEYSFRYLFPHESVSSAMDTFRETTIDAEDFEYLPGLYANRISEESKQQIAEHIEKIHGKTIGEIQQQSMTILSEYCAGFPNSTPEQISKFEQGLGPIVSAFHHGPNTADVLLKWIAENRKPGVESSADDTYERDLLVATSLFHDASDIILGVPRGDELKDIPSDLKARAVRELLYASFVDHEQEAHLISSTMLTGDYCDPFHHALDQTINSHEQFFAATTLDYATTGARAFELSDACILEGEIEQSERYRALAATIARIAVPVLVYVEHKYPAISVSLNDERMQAYLQEHYYLTKGK